MPLEKANKSCLWGSPGNFLLRRIFTLDHKAIGIQYLSIALFSVFLGMGLSLFMRPQLDHSAVGFPIFGDSFDSPGHYAALAVLHGSLMVFFVLTAAPQFGFGYFFLPLQIGARDMAFPFLSGLSIWLTVASLLAVTISFFLPISYGMSLWVVGAGCFCAGALLSALNFCVTVIDLRTRGMTLTRLPLTVWSWFVTAILSLLIFAVLLAACALLLSDRFAATHFFANSAGALGAPGLLWQRWFWFLAQSEVYVAILPCFGIVSHVLSIYARKPVWAERAVVLALCALGLCGFCIWGYHMFSNALNPNASMDFATLAAALGFPAVILLASWIGTLWGTKPQLNTTMLFALGFISLFLSGGVTGLALSTRGGSSAVTIDAVTGHFHLVMGVASTFAILAALFFWFPKMFGRQLNESLGKLHFWLTFLGVYCVFVPMHWLGLLNLPGSAPITTSPPAFGMELNLRAFIAVAAILTIAAQLIFFANFFWSLLRNVDRTVKNPWRATTLEWFVPSPPARGNFGHAQPVIYRGAYSFGVSFARFDFLAQHWRLEKVRNAESKELL